MKLNFWSVNEIEVQRRVKVIKKEMKANFEDEVSRYKEMLYSQQISVIDNTNSRRDILNELNEEIINDLKKEKSQLIDRLLTLEANYIEIVKAQKKKN